MFSFGLVVIFSLFSIFSSFLSTYAVQLPVETKLRKDLLAVRDSPVRPVKNYNDTLDAKFKFHLISIDSLDMKDQVLSLHLQIEMEWSDYKFTWDPEQYGAIDQIVMPADSIWRPDLIQYNKAGESNNIDRLGQDGTFARVHHTGTIHWTVSTVSRTNCPIEVRYYPFDIQKCLQKFASWTYDGNQVNLTLKDLKYPQNGSGVLPIGMDLENFHPSSEWDLISVPAVWTNKYYNCCLEPYPDIKFYLTLRRRAQFYLYNLVMPLMGISYLSLLVFYLPADSCEKITLCVSLLACQVMFLLLMMDSIPVTSLAVPLLGKLIIFNMMLNFLSVFCTTIVLNVHYRNPSTHKMPGWVRQVRYTCISKLLFVEAIPMPMSEQLKTKESFGKFSRLCTLSIGEIGKASEKRKQEARDGVQQDSGKFRKAVKNVLYVRNYMEKLEKSSYECEDWKFLASIMDRIFLIVFNIVFFIGTLVIMMGAPALLDQRVPLDRGSGKGDEVFSLQHQDVDYLDRDNNSLVLNEILDYNGSKVVFDE